MAVGVAQAHRLVAFLALVVVLAWPVLEVMEVLIQMAQRGPMAAYPAGLILSQIWAEHPERREI